MTAPRLHQVRPIQIDTNVATKTPARTAPTRTAPILSVENAEACMTSNAVRGPVRSIAPLVSGQGEQVGDHGRGRQPDHVDDSGA